MAKYTIRIGPSDFDGLRCDLDQERGPDPTSHDTQNEASEARPSTDGTTGQLVVKTILLLIALAITTSGGLGLATGNWAPLQSVWIVVAAPLGGLFDRYVGKGPPASPG